MRIKISKNQQQHKNMLYRHFSDLIEINFINTVQFMPFFRIFSIITYNFIQELNNYNNLLDLNSCQSNTKFYKISETMREIISLNIGQAGVQLGNSCWQLFCLEHNIDPSGAYNPGSQAFPSEYFAQSSNGKVTPRTLYIDLEPTVVDEIRIGKYKDLYDRDQLISGKEDAADLYARGYYTVGRQLADPCMERLRKEVEKCDELQGFMMFNSIGGGTGSGFGSLMLKKMSVEYAKKTKMGFTIFPSPLLSTSCVQPYNALLALERVTQYQDITVAIDNQALYRICSQNLGIQSPYYQDINRIVAQMVSNLTLSSRFSGSLNTSLRDFQTNLIPYPKAHFLMPSCSPFTSSERMSDEKSTLDQMTEAVFRKSNMMVSCDPREGKFIACSLNYRGDIVPKEACEQIISFEKKKTVQFVDWCPRAFKVGINNHPQTIVPGSEIANTSQSVSLLGNNTVISSIFKRIRKNVELLYAKRTFVFSFVGEGLQQSLIWQSMENQSALKKDYILMQQ